MRILKDEGTFDVLTKPENVIETIATAARVCYQSQDRSTPQSDLKLVKNIMVRGHHAMIEFSFMVVRFDLISRGVSQEQVRHRLSSFAQESSRYVDTSEFSCVVPPDKDENEEIISLNTKNGTLNISLAEWFELNEQTYRSLRSNGWKPDDARQTLPTAIKTQVVHGANLREWLHIFTMRCDKFAHWEIRGVMLNLLRWCQKNIPVIFDHFKFFTSSDGTEYARPVMSAFNLADKVNDYGTHFGFDEFVNKLDPLTSMRLYETLNKKHFK